MKDRTFIHISFLMILVFSLLSCQTVEKGAVTAENEIRIEGAWWAIYNVPEGYWKTWDKETSSYCLFQIRYTGDLKEGDIVAAGFHTSKINYEFEIDGNIDYQRKIIGTRNHSFQTWSNKPWSNDIFHIGHAHCWFKTKDGKKYDYITSISRCGLNTADEFDFVYTEDAEAELVKMIGEGKYRAEPCLGRPNVIGYSSVDDILKVEFSVEDDRFYSGNIVFFSGDTVQVAATELFLSHDKKISSTINNGEAIYGDGRVNVVTIDLKSLAYEEGKTIDDIEGLSIVICDGKQYSSLSDRTRYDYIAFSRRVYLTE